VGTTLTKRNGSVFVAVKARLMLTRQIHQAVVRLVRGAIITLGTIVDLGMVRTTAVLLTVLIDLLVIRTTVSSITGAIVTPVTITPLALTRTAQAMRRLIAGGITTTITTAEVIIVITITAEAITTTGAVETAGKRLPRLTFGSRFNRRMLGCRVTNPTGVLIVDVIAGISAKKIAVY
jgi:hypothetical protein